VGKKKVDQLELDFSDIEEATKEEDYQEVEQKRNKKGKRHPKKEAKKKVKEKTNTLSEKQAIAILDMANVTAKSFIKGSVTDNDLAIIYQNAFNAAKAINS